MSQLDRKPNLSYDHTTLERVPVFQGLSSDERHQLAAIAHTVLFQPGEYVLREGEVEQKLWIVIAGQCEVLRAGTDTSHPPVRLAVLERLDNFGEMSFFHSAAHSASVRAITALELLCIERNEFNALIDLGNQAAFKVALNVVRSLSERLRRMDQWVAQLLAGNGAAHHVDEWENFRQQLFNRWSL